jgi:hypothetical protein
MGLSTCGGCRRLQFIGERGKVATKGAIATGNIANQRVNAKLGLRIYAEARYLRILWWKSWKEKPLRQPTDLIERT